MSTRHTHEQHQTHATCLSTRMFMGHDLQQVTPAPSDWLAPDIWARNRLTCTCPSPSQPNAHHYAHDNDTAQLGPSAAQARAFISCVPPEGVAEYDHLVQSLRLAPGLQRLHLNALSWLAWISGCVDGDTRGEVRTWWFSACVQFLHLYGGRLDLLTSCLQSMAYEGCTVSFDRVMWM